MPDELEPGGTPAQAGETKLEGAPQAAAGAGEGVAPAGDTTIEYAFEMPEGIEADKGRLDAFTAIAKEAKLSPEVAQKVVGLEAARIQAEADAHVAMVKGWAETVTADPVLGVAENQGVAKSVIEKFGTPELRQYLNDTGLGNHPELVKFAYAVGKAMSEDSLVRGQAETSNVSVAKRMFPSMN